MKHKLNIFCNSQKVGIIEIDLTSDDVKLSLHHKINLFYGWSSGD